MVEQQLVDYIKKARTAGQQDEQTRALLRKNGWSDIEVNEAISSASQKETEAKPNSPPIEHQISGPAQINTPKNAFEQKPKEQNSQKPYAFQKQQQFKPPADVQMPKERELPESGGLVAKIIVAVILISIIGTGIYFAFFQGDLLQGLVDKTLSYFSPSVAQPANSENTSENTGSATQTETTPASTELSTQVITSVPEEYDSSNIGVAAFSQSGDKAVYCAPLKSNGAVSCFLNGQKFFGSPYTFKPYWIGISPNSQRIVFFFYDSAARQSFVSENGVESQRYNGTITYPAFSSDSKNFSYVVMQPDGQYFAVANGAAMPSHDKILTAPKWSSDGNYILYGARDGKDMLWVADKIQASSQ